MGKETVIRQSLSAGSFIEARIRMEERYEDFDCETR
jgi:hypothetical protein